MSLSAAVVGRLEGVDAPARMDTEHVGSVPSALVEGAAHDRSVVDRQERRGHLRQLPLPAPAESRAAALAWMAIAVAIAALYLYLLLSYWSPAHPGVDQNGYLAGGRQFAATGSTGLPLVTDFDFVGRMWVTAPSGVNYPKYPLGLPILYAACLWLAPVMGWNGAEVAHLVSPISATLATLGIFAIVRRLTGSGYWGLLAMLLLGTGQVFLTLADNPNSHAAGTCAVVWGMCFLLRWIETARLWRGMAAGFLFGFAYLIRYTDGLMVLLLAVSMLYMARWRWPGWRLLLIGSGGLAVLGSVAFLIARVWGGSLAARWPWLLPLREAQGMHRPALFLLIGVVGLAWASLFVRPSAAWRLALVGLAWLAPVLYQTGFNMVAMQSFTSYAGTNESTGFALAYFQRNWELMVRTLHDQALFFVAPIGLLGLIVMARRMPLIAALLALWFFPSVLLYTAYYWAPDNFGVSYSRFILTQVPALLIAACWLLGDLIRQEDRVPLRFGRWLPRVAVGVVVLSATSVSAVRSINGTEWGRTLNLRASLETQARQNVNLWGLGRQVRAVVPDGSVLVSDGERLHHFQWLGRFRLYDSAMFDLGGVKRMIGRNPGENGDPDPIDPTRVNFLEGVYKDKDQAWLTGQANDLVAKALAANTRVFIAMNVANAERFRRLLDRKRFEAKPVGFYHDVSAPRSDALATQPGRRNAGGIGPVNTRRANAAQAAGEPQRYRILEVVPAQPSAATTQATTKVTTRATTRATTRPTTKPSTRRATTAP